MARARMLCSVPLAIRAASSWGAALVLVASGLLTSAGCGESESGVPRTPSAAGGHAGGGGCADCGGESGAPSAPEPPPGGSPSGGDASGEQPGVGGEAGAAPMLAPELTLRSVSISQTLEVPLMTAGRALPIATRPVPLIARKRGLLRAFVDVDARFEPRRLLGVLDVRGGGREHSVLSERTVTQASAQDDLASTFVFEVPEDDLGEGSEYRVRVLEADTSPLARFPETGFAAFGAELLAPLRLVLVPYVANGFTPKTGDAEIAALRRRLVALYPTRDVEISVSGPVTLGYPVDADGAGWDDALDLIYELREQAAPPGDTFFYGLLAPAADYDAYCPSGCLLGYSVVADARTESERGSIGVGIFPDGSGTGDAEDTAAHELGHALGRDHAPCGISDPRDTDPDWPSDVAHRNGLIGAYGYDFDLGRLVKPRPPKDFMSYCTPSWVSDYTYSGIFQRLVAIAAQQSALQSVQLPQTFRVARVARSGQSRWLAPRVKPRGALGSRVELLDASERVVGAASARFARVDHGRGGYIWLPETEIGVPGAVSVDLRPFGGAVLAL
ncbi:MAG: hypothetical protein K0R38_1517 [Polyangiaceae bacterium]|nr:hypothetical protein [Polyangiaceae bacterium]